MAKFVYRLQNILDVKMKLEDQAKSGFSMASARVNEEEEKLERLYEEKAQLEEEYRKKSLGPLDLFELQFSKDCVEYKKGEIANQKKELERARKNLEIARYQLNEAMKERKIHEKLKENAFEEFLQEINEEEKKEIDQLVSFTYNNRSEEE